MLLGITNLGVVSGLQHHPPRRVLTWKGQYQGRLGISPSEGQQRLEAVTISIQIPQQFTRSFHYRPVCQQDQHSVTTILQLEARPSSQSSGCLFSPLGAGQTIPVSTFQSHRESLNQDSNRNNRVCLSHSPSLASTGLVPTVVEVAGESSNPSSCETRSTPECRLDSTSSTGGGTDVPSRMAYLRQGFAVQGFSARVTNILLQSWWEHTHTAYYNSAWKKWCSWCVTKQVNPLSAPLADIMEFLTDNFELGLQYRTLNTLHSAISMTHSRVDDCTVGTHPLVVRLLKGMFNKRPPVPRYTGSWKVTSVVESLKRSSEELTLLQLSKKVVTLMALSNADRCSDLAALDRDYIRWTLTGVQFTVVQLTKTQRTGPPRTVFYSALQDDPDICPVSNIRRYIEMTTPHVNNMKTPKPVFITSQEGSSSYSRTLDKG